MRELDRRTVVTGLAAVAVAGVAVPTLLAAAAPLVRIGRAYTPEDSEADRLVRSARRIFWTSPWHVHIHSPIEQTFRHVDSGGVTLATDPNEPEHVWFVRRFREQPQKYDHLADLAYAALYCQPRACWAYGRRLLMDGRDEGAFFLYASDTPIPRLVTEDAPPLPRFA
jgi:hypothetical protein